MSTPAKNTPSEPVKPTWLGRLASAMGALLGGLTLWLPGASTATVLACALALWIWSGTGQSLTQALALAQTWVPELRALTLTEADASLREGGSMDSLVWDDNGLTVTADHVQLDWDLLPLIKGQAVRVALKARELRVHDTRPPSKDPLQPLESLALPLPLSVDVNLQRFSLQGPSPLVLEQLQAHYNYDDDGDDNEATHELSVQQVVLGQGRYELDLALQALAPMTLRADLKGHVSGQLPGSGAGQATTWQADVSARVRGTLAGADAMLALTAQLGQTTSPEGKRGPELQAEASVRPWSAQPVQALQAQLRQLDLSALWPQLPATLLSGNVQAGPQAPNANPEATDWRLNLSLTNAAPGPWDEGRLPLSSARVLAHGSPAAVLLDAVEARLGQGEVQGQGQWQGGATPSWQGQFTVHNVQAQGLHSALAPVQLSGQLSAKQQGPNQATVFTADLQGQGNAIREDASRPAKRLSLRKLLAHGEWDGQRLRLSELWVQAAGAELRASGDINPQPTHMIGEARLKLPGLVLQAKGHLSAEQGQGQLDGQMADAAQVHRWLGRLPWVGNRVPPLHTLSGQAQWQAQWQGGWADGGPKLDVHLAVDRLKAQNTPQSAAVEARVLTWHLHGTPAALQSNLNAQLLLNGARADVELKGRATNATSPKGQLTVDHLALRWRQPGALLALAVANDTPLTLTWQGSDLNLATGTLRAQPVAQSTAHSTTQKSAQQAAATDTTRNTPPATTLPPLKLSWSQLSWAKHTLSAQGQLSQLHLDWGNALPALGGPNTRQPLADAGLGGDLVMGGDWQVVWPTQAPEGQALPAPTLKAALRRQSGDLSFRNPDSGGFGQAETLALAGLRQAEISLNNTAEVVQAQLRWDSALAGEAKAQVQTRLSATPTGWSLAADAPVSGQVSARMPQLGVWSSLLAPPGWRAKGRLQLDASVGGVLSQPQWSGELRATELALRSVVEGLEFGQGELLARMDGNRVDITRLALEGAGGAKHGGSLSGNGHVLWETGPSGLPLKPQLKLQAKAERLRISSRADRRLTVSGQVDATLQDLLLLIRGDLKVDQALFILPDETAPALGDDVVVRQAKAATPATPGTPVKTDLLVRIDLGDQLEVRGQGLKTKLTGRLSLVSTPTAPALRVLGEVRTQTGTYRAYAQQLNIQSGVIRFSGPYDDPGLNILAVRPASVFRGSDSQVVGVNISGSARAPLVRLYADPDLPDSEKLAYLVLGRSASGAGAEAAILQQAALALLSGNGGAMDTSLAGRLGLDDISFRGASTQTDGTTQAAAVSLGKRLSERLYVAYETSLSSAVGTVSLFYDVSRRLTLRAQAGGENAVDLIFTLPHD